MRAALFAAALAAALSSASAVEVPRLAGKLLEPASCGVRQTLWIRHYAAELFLPPEASPTAVADPAEPKLLRVRILNPTLMPPNIPARWREALAPVVSRDTLARLEAAYNGLRRNDSIVVAYRPGHGVTLQVNERQLAHVPGHAAIDALLRAWAEEGVPLEEQLVRTTARNPCA